MQIPSVKWGRYQWIHLTSFNEELAAWLREEYNIHELDLDDCLAGKAQHPKRESYPEYNFFILQFPIASPISRNRIRVSISQIHFFVSKTTLISISHHPITLVNQLFQMMQQEKELAKAWLKKGPGMLFHELVDRLTDDSLRVVEQLGRQVDKIDEHLLELKRTAIEDISLSRRNLIISTTTIKPMVRIFTELEYTSVVYLNGDLSEYWSNIKDHLTRMSDLLADYDELLDGLSRAFDILLTHKTNQIIQVLTIFSVIMLPLTLLSGIYGMNVRLPLADNLNAFYIILTIMIAISLSMIIFFKTKRWM